MENSDPHHPSRHARMSAMLPGALMVDTAARSERLRPSYGFAGPRKGTWLNERQTAYLQQQTDGLMWRAADVLRDLTNTCDAEKSAPEDAMIDVKQQQQPDVDMSHASAGAAPSISGRERIMHYRKSIWKQHTAGMSGCKRLVMASSCKDSQGFHWYKCRIELSMPCCRVRAQHQPASRRGCPKDWPCAARASGNDAAGPAADGSSPGYFRGNELGPEAGRGL